MSFRPSLVVLGAAAALVVVTVTPAVAATAPSAVSTAVSTAAPRAAATAAPVSTTAAPRTVTLSVPCPPPTVVVRDGKTIVLTPAERAKLKRSDPSCRQLLERVVGLPMPKGAPETGGGGMATEVGAWG